MPRIKTVAIINPNTEQSLQLQSISGSTVHFHASFFQAKVSYYSIFTVILNEFKQKASPILATLSA